MRGRDARQIKKATPAAEPDAPVESRIVAGVGAAVESTGFPRLAARRQAAMTQAIDDAINKDGVSIYDSEEIKRRSLAAAAAVKAGD